MYQHDAKCSFPRTDGKLPCTCYVWLLEVKDKQIANLGDAVGEVSVKLNTARSALKEALLQIEYLEEKANYQTGSGEATKEYIKYVLSHSSL